MVHAFDTLSDDIMLAASVCCQLVQVTRKEANETILLLRLPMCFFELELQPIDLGLLLNEYVLQIDIRPVVTLQLVVKLSNGFPHLQDLLVSRFDLLRKLTQLVIEHKLELLQLLGLLLEIDDALVLVFDGLVSLLQLVLLTLDLLLQLADDLQQLG